MDKVSTEGKSGGRLLQPPTPIIRGDNWPTLEVQKTTLEDLSAAQPDPEEQAYTETAGQDAPAATGSGDWNDDGFDDANDGGGAAMGGIAADGDDFDFGDDGDWGDDLDDLGDLGEPDAPKETVKNEMAGLQEVSDDATFQMPTAGRTPAGCWVANSSHAADHMAAGAATSSMQLLNRQIAATEFSQLKSSMLGCYLSATVSVPGVPGSPQLSLPLMRNDASGHPGNESLPRSSLRMKNLVAGIRNGYRFFQGGKFNDSKAAFQDVLAKIPLVVTDNRNESNEMKEMLEICREYITAIRIKSAMAECVGNPVRSTELSAYLTHCNLQPVHMLLVLRSAMGTAFKYKNFIVAAGFARRLLELPDMNSERNADLRVKATKVLQKSEQMARNEHELNYNESTGFVIDCRDFVPIRTGQPCVKSSFSGSSYADEGMKNKVCLTDNISAVGVETIGLVTGS